MSGKQPPITSLTYKGRSFGIIVLTAAQLLIGTIHLVIGLALLAAQLSAGTGSLAYAVYTVLFGALIVVFAGLIWRSKKAGWVGTVAVSLFVITADTLTVLGLSSVPGIPSFAAPTEIGYSLLVIIYLSLPHVRKKFGV